MSWFDFGENLGAASLEMDPSYYDSSAWDMYGGYDFATDPGYASYDFNPEAFNAYGGYDMGGYGGGYEGDYFSPEAFNAYGGYTYNTTTGQIEQSGGGGPIYGGGGGGVNPSPGAPEAQQGFMPSGGGGPNLYNQANQFLNTPLGRIGASVGLGLLGQGASRLFAGETPTYKPTPYQVSPITAAGQSAVMNAMNAGAGPNLSRALTLGTGGQADIAQQLTERVGRERAAETAAAPYEQATRMTALATMPNLMQPEEDPIRARIREELMSVLGGTGTSPQTQKRQQLEEQETRARLYRQLGRDYELTQAGDSALNNMRERHNAEKYQERQATIMGFSPLEQGRQVTSESVRRGRLSDAATMGQYGIRGVPQNLTALSQIVPINALLGGNPEQANMVNANLQNQASLASYNAELNRQQNLAQGIGSVFGTVAGSVAAKPSASEQYYQRILAGATPNTYGAYP